MTTGIGIPHINGVQHSWGNISVNINGVVVTGITAISYKEDQDMEEIYGIGNYPVGRGYGRIKCEGSITLLRSEIEVLRDSVSTHRLQDIAPFIIVVCYIPLNGEKMITHTLRNCQFKNDSLEWKEGDMKNESQLDLMISHIERK